MLQILQRLAGGDRRLELCLLNAAISNIHPFGPGQDVLTAKQNQKLSWICELPVLQTPVFTLQKGAGGGEWLR